MTPARSGAAGGLLAVHAHPDDETLSTGALLAAWASAGRPVTVVTCTRGERGEVIPATLAHLAEDPAALAAHRETELAGALAALGVVDHVFLDRVPATVGTADGAAAARFEDSGMAWVRPGQAGAGADVPRGAFVRVEVADAAERLAAVIRDRRPDVVVGYEPGGGYGHPDHVHAHRVMTAAVAAAAQPGPAGEPAHAVRVVLHAAVDSTELHAARVEIAARGPVSDTDGAPLHPDDPAAPLPSAAVDPGDVAVRVDVPAVLDRVLAALAEHATQVQGVRRWSGDGVAVGCFALSNRVLQPLLRRESYVVVPGARPEPMAWPAHVRGIT